MSLRKLTIPFTIVMILLSSQLMAQQYTTGVGAKLYAKSGVLGGLNVKHSMVPNQALEGSLLFGSGTVGLEGLYDFQGDIPSVEGLQYFAGGGALLGFGTSPQGKTSFGIRLTGGAEYKIPEVPFAVSLGIDPFFTLAPHTHTSLALGIGMRYILQ